MGLKARLVVKSSAQNSISIVMITSSMTSYEDQDTIEHKLIDVEMKMCMAMVEENMEINTMKRRTPSLRRALHTVF